MPPPRLTNDIMDYDLRVALRGAGALRMCGQVLRSLLLHVMRALHPQPLCLWRGSIAQPPVVRVRQGEATAGAGERARLATAPHRCVCVLLSSLDVPIGTLRPLTLGSPLEGLSQPTHPACLCMAYPLSPRAD